MAILYTTATCPQCRFLKEKLEERGVSYALCNDPKILEEEGILHVPTLELPGGKRLDMAEALKWLQEVHPDEKR